MHKNCTKILVYILVAALSVAISSCVRHPRSNTASAVNHKQIKKPSFIFKDIKEHQPNQYFKASLYPSCTNNCTGFTVTVKNNSDKDIEIDWNKTLYIANGATSGGFMFDGIVYSKRHEPKPPDIVFANGYFSKNILPVNLVDYDSGRYGLGWQHKELSYGETGIYLTVNVDGKTFNEKITGKIVAE